ncbi:MAG TPA: Xaa-Pro peptidase family protein [Verrucomicrobiae bacterium]|jgi:Xaa-Pro aminopeptidase|nr:Xaa-Pro peptidase family protein [Verrucomicrobiae bacterium]
MNESDNLLIVADSDHDADMLYAVGMFTPDPFIYFRLGGKCHVVVTDLEMDRARRKAAHCRVLSYNQCIDKLRRKVKRPGMAAVISLLFHERKIRKIFVPANFPHGLARELRNYKIKVRVKKGGIFPQREFKNADEIKKISAALIMAEVGLSEGIQALKTSKVLRDGKLSYHGVPLTSEKLRGIIETAILQAGGTACHTIVAGGRQACDPHEPGHGPLRANEPIVLDVFPRSCKTGYFGDITRTVVRGRATEAVRRVYNTVARAQELAFAQLRPENKAANVHKAVQKFFDDQGYKTGKKNGRLQGFFHGTGHGLGMDVHESPRVGVNSRDVLAAGHVVTVEPGLYYSEIGGIRLEDVGAITPQGAKNLTKFEKSLEV